MTARTTADCVAEAKRVMEDCETARNVLSGIKTFETGQSILSDAARTIRDLLAVIEKQKEALDEMVTFFRGDPASDDYDAHAVIDRARAALGEKP